MNKSKYKRGRKTKIKYIKDYIPKKGENVWGNWTAVPYLAKKYGYIPTTVYSWIRQKKIEAYNYSGVIIVRKNQKLPPGKTLL